MRIHVTPREAKAAAALARRIQQTDAHLRLGPATPAARRHSAHCRHLRRAVFDEFQPQALHEHIITEALAAATGSQTRYPRFEAGLLEAHLRQHTGPATPAEPSAQIHQPVRQSFTACEIAVIGALLSLEDRLHQSAHTQTARLLQARRHRAPRRATHRSR